MMRIRHFFGAINRGDPLVRKHRYNKPFLSITMFAALLAVGSQAYPADFSTRPASWRPTFLRLTGVWNVSVTLRDCVSGDPVKPAFPAMNQFGIDGSESEVGSGTPPSGRYPSFGTWRYIGNHQFDSKFSFFLFNPDGSYAGTQDVTRTITLSNDANQFSSQAEVSIYDPQHNLLKTGCATETAARF
jgi:hypothetical protein